MVMRDIGSSHYPETRYMSSGTAEGNGKGEWILPVSRNNHTLTVLLYRYNTFMSVHLLLLSIL